MFLTALTVLHYRHRPHAADRWFFERDWLSLLPVSSAHGIAQISDELRYFTERLTLAVELTARVSRWLSPQSCRAATRHAPHISLWR